MWKLWNLDTKLGEKEDTQRFFNYKHVQKKITLKDWCPFTKGMSLPTIMLVDRQSQPYNHNLIVLDNMSLFSSFILYYIIFQYSYS
jgi:hypothetical protein